jgi:hypothetical protein
MLSAIQIKNNIFIITKGNYMKKIMLFIFLGSAISMQAMDKKEKLISAISLFYNPQTNCATAKNTYFTGQEQWVTTVVKDSNGNFNCYSETIYDNTSRNISYDNLYRPATTQELKDKIDEFEKERNIK